MYINKFIGGFNFGFYRQRIQNRGSLHVCYFTGADYGFRNYD